MATNRDAGRMRAHGAALSLMVVCSAMLLDTRDVRADGTLFRWSVDIEATGGPSFDEPLVTDRPDFTEASSTVGRGVYQLEVGYTLVQDLSNGTRTREHSYPEALLRAGIWDDWLEFRIAQNVVSIREDPLAFGGGEDLYLGFKLALTSQAGYLPEMALIPQMTVPTGHQRLTSNRVLGGVNWIYGWEVSDCISTAGSTQFNSTLDETSGNVFLAGAQSWTVAYRLTESIGAYTEWFMITPHGADTEKPQHYFNGGLTLLAGPNFQWDIRAGVGLNDAADDFFLGTGFAVRFGGGSR